MNLNLKIVFAASTLLGTAFGLTSLAAAPMSGLVQAAPGVQASGQSAADGVQVEKAWWVRRYHYWHPHYYHYWHPHYYHYWHRW